MESVEDRSGTHEHMGVQNRKRHATVETVAMAGMVWCAESCWRSNSNRQEFGTRRSAQPRIGADFAAQLVQCTKD